MGGRKGVVGMPRPLAPPILGSLSNIHGHKPPPLLGSWVSSLCRKHPTSRLLLLPPLLHPALPPPLPVLTRPEGAGQLGSLSRRPGRHAKRASALPPRAPKRPPKAHEPEK